MSIFSRQFLPVSPALLVTLALLTLPTHSLRAQTTGPLFVSATRQAARSVAQDASVVRSRDVEVQVAQLSSAAARSAGATLDLNLFPDATFTATLDRVDTSTSGFVWVGHFAEVPMSSVTLAVEGTTVYGTVLLPGGVYLVKPAGSGISTIVEIDQSVFPPEAEPLVPSASVERDAPGLAPQMEGDDGLRIDVLVLYTPAAATAAGGTAAMNTLIANAISLTNTSYANSGVYQRVRLAIAQPVSYTESGDIGTDLSNMTSGAGAFGGVAALRNQYRADLVSLMTNTPASPYCGVAWHMASLSVGFAPNGYSVVEQSCAVGNLSFPHELGHNMGLRHDWYVDAGVTPTSYAHGYVDSVARWRTVMAYNNRCSAQGFNCTRLPYWSNPGILLSGAPMGVPSGTSAACVAGSLAGNCDADDHRLLNESAYFVANFRVRSAGAVTVGFGGSLGLWNYASATGWQQLHPLTPTVMLRRDIDGNGQTDVVAVFPGFGVWAYLNSTSWVNLHALDATEIKAGDVNGNGLVDLVFNFPGQGVWLRYDSGGWVMLHPVNANRMAVGDLDDVTGRADVILSFASYGVWAYMNATSWVALTGLPASDLQVGDLDGTGKGDLIAQFSGYGVWVYRNNSSWWQLHPGEANGITVGNIDGDAGRRSDVVLNLPPYGVWVWGNNTSWTQLHTLQSTVMSTGDLDNNGIDEVFLGFAGFGLYARYNNTSWLMLNSNLPASMAASR
jgi:Metallo-peptidase family M12